MKLPVMTYATGQGYTVIGYATGIRSATVVFRMLLDIPKNATLYVFERSSLMQEINGGPSGYVHAIAFGK